MTSGGRLPLVGRDELLRDVLAALQSARAARGSFLLLTGEPGIGKTRLAHAAAEAADGFHLVWSWCAPEPEVGSFRPWVQIVRELAAADAEAARAIAGSRVLTGLVASGAGSADTAVDPETARWQLWSDVVDLLGSAATHRPLLIVPDDLHDAQESSLWLLAHLAPAVRSRAVAVLGTALEAEFSWPCTAPATGTRRAITSTREPLRCGAATDTMGECRLT
jgi:predicted ATPase